MTSKKTSFQDSWSQDQEFKAWVLPVENKNNYASCKFCGGEIYLSNMGVQALRSHAIGKKHQAKARANASASILSYTTSTASISPAPSPAPTVSVSKEVAAGDPVAVPVVPVKAPTTMDKFVMKDNVTRAEILWCLETIMTHKSLRSAEKDVPLMVRMFPDSEVAKKMQLGRDKISYSLIFGIAPYFKEQLLNLLSEADFHVVGFDESLNKITGTQQMDLNIRFWDPRKQEVSTRYLTSQFLGRSRAVDLLAAFKEGVKGLDDSKLLQVSMDGPNVNFSFLRELQAERKNTNESLVDLGSCGIHILHGAFKHGARKTTWQLDNFLRASYNLFKNVPARRALYTEYTGSSTFPLKFCGHRWLENRSVAERAIDMVPSLKLFVESCKKEKNNISCNSYHTLQTHLNDKLLIAKLAFFQSVAREVEPFLREYQTDDPLVPFLHTDLCKILHNLLDRFVKPDLLKQTSSVTLDFVNDVNNHLLPEHIRLGFDAKNALKAVRGLKEKDVLNYRLQCKSFLQEVICKMLIRSPLTYPLTKACTAFDPSLIAADPDLARRRMEKLLSILTEKGKIRGSEADAASRQFREVTGTSKQRFDDFRREDVRVDKFWCPLLTGYTELRKLMQLVCCLSHGNANLERGFAVNADCLFENMWEESVVARRQVYDAVQSLGGIKEVEVTKKLIQKARNAHALYTEDRERRKLEAKGEEVKKAAKRAREAEARELAEKKRKIMEERQRELDEIDKKISELQK